MNSLIEVQALAKKLVREHLGSAWMFTWNKRKTAFGVCKYRTREIQLSSYHSQHETMDAIEQTILHEIAHALTDPRAQSHGWEWERKAREVGVRNPSASRAATAKVDPRDKFEYAIVFGEEVVKGYHRRPNPDTFKRVKGMWVTGRKAETKGLLVIVRL